jgi:hypothetical protein
MSDHQLNALYFKKPKLGFKYLKPLHMFRLPESHLQGMSHNCTCYLKITSLRGDQTLISEKCMVNLELNSPSIFVRAAGA